MTNTIYLSYTDARKKGLIVDREKFLDKYWDGKAMLKGTPIIINVEGSYIMKEDVVVLALNKKKAYNWEKNFYNESNIRMDLRWIR